MDDDDRDGGIAGRCDDRIPVRPGPQMTGLFRGQPADHGASRDFARFRTRPGRGFCMGSTSIFGAYTRLCRDDSGPVRDLLVGLRQSGGSPGERPRARSATESWPVAAPPSDGTDGTSPKWRHRRPLAADGPPGPEHPHQGQYRVDRSRRPEWSGHAGHWCDGIGEDRWDFGAERRRGSRRAGAGQGRRAG